MSCTKYSSSKLLSEVEDLRKKLSEAGTPLNNNEIWSIQQALQVTCGHLLVAFQEIALEKGVERDLWNFGFRTTITELQSQAKDKKKGCNEAKDVLYLFLNAASGFYLQLLNQICSINSLDLVFRRKDSIYGLVGGGLSSIISVKAKDNVTKNALYLCQYCLIHLGDLARYRHQAKQAETYYRHAVTVAPTSGHPYNQLALLEAGRGNRLTSVFLYIRALCVPAPFLGAPSNLIQTLNKVLNNRLKEEAEIDSCEIKVGALTRMTKEEYINLFLHFHSSLFLKGDVETAKEDLPRLSSALSMLVATTTLTRSSLVQMFAVNVFALHYFSSRFTLRLTEDNASRKDEESLVDPKECEGVLVALEDLMVGMLAALLLPIHTMKEPEVVLTYPALPAIRLMFEWISLEEKLPSPSLRKKQQIWPGLCTLINFLQEPLKSLDTEQYKEIPLPEDWDLQEFQPLHKVLCKYKYRESGPRLSPEQNSLLRARRLTNLALKFCETNIEGGAVIKKSTTNEDNGEGQLLFEATSNQTPPVEEVLDLERLTLRPRSDLDPSSSSNKKKEKVGILKPQGTLERSKGPTKEPQPPTSNPLPQTLPHHPQILKDPLRINETKSLFPGEKRPPGVAVGGPPKGEMPPTTVIAKPKTTRTNVALEAILKRNSNPQEAKQVTFQTPSPAASPNPSDASTESQRSQISTPPLPNLSQPPPNLSQPPPTHIGLAPGGPPLSNPPNPNLSYSQRFSQPFSRSLEHPRNLPPNVSGSPNYPHSINSNEVIRSEDPPFMRVRPPPPSGMFGVGGEEGSGFYPSSPQGMGRIRPPQERSLFPRSPGGLPYEPPPHSSSQMYGNPSQPPITWKKNPQPPDNNLETSLGSVKMPSLGGFGGLFPPPRPMDTPNFSLSLHQSFSTGESSLFRDSGTPRSSSISGSSPGTSSGLNPPSNSLTGGSLSHSGSNYFSPGGMASTSPWWNKEIGNGGRNHNFPFSQGSARPPFHGGNTSPPSLDTSVPPPNHHGLGCHGSGSSTFSSNESSSLSHEGNSSMRMSNTYSLFGPLGGGREPLQQPFPQNHRMLNPSAKQSQQPPQQQLLQQPTSQPQQFSPHQSLWPGSSPLQRLLEQKFSSK